ncbi:MAG TPA: radical SAM family heme chaperone HemW [Chthoniobacterales bacterium]|nr:radical SAM family heme chaperone HemW [Chthoniobacterales bacterium]
MRHVYVHIPFCARICPYCAFYKERADPAQTQRFCDAIMSELEAARSRFELAPHTIFFGGGTPTALSTAQLDVVLSGFHECVDLRALAEWTVEANPGSVSARKAALLKARGVTRISLGVQSWDDDLLALLGREHNAAQAEASYHVMRDAGFPSVSIDLMFGLPGQTLAQWEQTLERTVSLQPDHISAYCLTYEEDTEFFLRHARGEYRQDESSDARFFEAAHRILENAGYTQYEISNYARAGHECLHNRGYWAGHDYIGIGPSAFSTVGSQRWQNVADYRAYADRVLRGESAVATTEALTPEMKRAEQIALSLRTRFGVPAEWLDRWPAERQEFVDLGLMERRDGVFVLTRRGRLLADSVAAAFV